MNEDRDSKKEPSRLHIDRKIKGGRGRQWKRQRRYGASSLAEMRRKMGEMRRKMGFSDDNDSEMVIREEPLAEKKGTRGSAHAQKRPNSFLRASHKD